MATPELDGAMRRRLQAYVHIYDFLTDSVWEQLLSAEIPRRDKIACLVTHSAKLGLQNASEPTLGMLCALCHWTTWKADPQAPITCADFQSVKHEIRMALETCVSKGLCGPWLQQLPSEREALSDLDDLVPCKVPTMELRQFYEKIHCVRIGTQKGAPCKLYMLWKVFLRLLQVPVKQTLVLHHHLLLLWLACLHVREGSRFHLCLCGRPVLV